MCCHVPCGNVPTYFITQRSLPRDPLAFGAIISSVRPSPSKSPTRANFAGNWVPLQSMSASIGWLGIGAMCCHIPCGNVPTYFITQRSLPRDPLASGAITISARPSPSKSPTREMVPATIDIRLQRVVWDRSHVLPISGSNIPFHYPEIIAAGSGRIGQDGEFCEPVGVEVANNKNIVEEWCGRANDVQVA